MNWAGWWTATLWLIAMSCVYTTENKENELPARIFHAFVAAGCVIWALSRMGAW